MPGCRECVLGVLQPPAKPGAAQAKVPAKEASNLLHLPTSLLNTRCAARCSCFGCCWERRLTWRPWSHLKHVWVHRACPERAAAACQAWCSASKASRQGSFESVASTNEPSQHKMGSTSLVHRMLLGETLDMASVFALKACLGVQSVS